MHMSKVLSSVMAGTTASSSSETACTPSSDSQNGGKQQSMALFSGAVIQGGNFSININTLRTFALIVSAHPCCARNSLPRHALSARAVGEMWRYIALVGTLVSTHGFNSLKYSVTPYFLLINHFLCQLSTF